MIALGAITGILIAMVLLIWTVRRSNVIGNSEGTTNDFSDTPLMVHVFKKESILEAINDLKR